jgi:hypothetical protein
MAILGLGCLAGVAVAQNHLVSAPVIGEVALHRNFDDDQLYPDCETPEEFGRPEPKSSHRLISWFPQP